MNFLYKESESKKKYVFLVGDGRMCYNESKSIFFSFVLGGGGKRWGLE